MTFSKTAWANLLLISGLTALGYLIEFQTLLTQIKRAPVQWLYFFYPLIFGMLGTMFLKGSRITRFFNIFLLGVLVSVNRMILQNESNDPVVFEGSMLSVMWVISSCVVGGLILLPFLKFNDPS